MTQYKRAMKKRLGLLSVINDTTIIFDEEGIFTSRPNQGRTLRGRRKDDGRRWGYPSRDSSEGWGSALQYQQDCAESSACEPGFSGEDSRKFGPGIGPQGATKKIGEAA
jgi:hypothetical protein